MIVRILMERHIEFRTAVAALPGAAGTAADNLRCLFRETNASLRAKRIAIARRQDYLQAISPRFLFSVIRNYFWLGVITVTLPFTDEETCARRVARIRL